MAWLHSAAFCASLVLLGMLQQTSVCADARGATPAEPAAVLDFPDYRSDLHWKVQQFWPLTRAYGWRIADLPDGAYKIVVRVAAQRAKHLRSISADDARREFVSGEQGLLVNNSGAPRYGTRADGSRTMTLSGDGFVSCQVIDLNDLGLDSPKPLRLHVRFWVNKHGTGGGCRLLTKLTGTSASSSPNSKSHWKDGELYLATFRTSDEETGIGIRYDVFLVCETSAPTDDASEAPSADLE